jgi:DNA-binding XRE family transcriptional regulator
MTQAEAGKQFEVTSFTVGNWEKGYTLPQILHMPRLIKFLGYDPTKHNPNSIAEHLLIKRRELGWTQKMAARSLGVDPCTWSGWECGGTIMVHRHRRLVASFLDLDEGIVNEKMRRQWNERHRK